MDQTHFLNLGEGIDEILHNSNANRMDIIHELFVTTNGRLNRKSLIYRWLFLSLVFGVINILFQLLGMLTVSFPFYILQLVLGIVSTICCITMAIRRFHDMNKQGLWVLLLFIPLLNFFVSLFLIGCKGNIGPNDYGPDPLQ